MREVNEELLDDVAFKVGLRLDRMLVRLGDYILPDTAPRRIELEREFGRMPSSLLLRKRRTMGFHLDAFKRFGLLPEIHETRNLRSRATS